METTIPDDQFDGILVDNLSDNEHSQDSKDPALIKLARPTSNRQMHHINIKNETNENSDIKQEGQNSDDISDDEFFNGIY